MKILLGVPEYVPYHTGGGGEVYKNLAENYQQTGHEVAVVYGYYPTKTILENIRKYKRKGITLYQVPEIPYPKKYPFLQTALPPNPQAGASLRKIIANENPDVAHLHGYGLILINLLAKKLTAEHVPYIFTIHGYPESQRNTIWPIREIWKKYVDWIMNPTLKQAAAVTAVSNYTAADERNIAPQKTTVIPNGLNRKPLQELANVDTRIKHNIPENALYILSLGRISKMKGFQKIIGIISEFEEKGVEIKYLIAGKDNGYKKSLENLIRERNLENNVEFIGYVGGKEKNKYLVDCDALTIPSEKEPFGLVALEGMYFGKPILSSNKGGLRFVLKNYAKKINLDEKNIVEKINKYKKIKDHLHKNEFRWEGISQQYLKLLKRHAA